MKVLIVDDSRAMRLLIRRALRQAGYGGLDVVEAEDGQKGLDAVAEEQPDLILSDWNMPNMNGLEFLQTVRSRGVTTPFGFVTTEGSGDKFRQALTAGANFHLSKPFTSDHIADAIGKYVR